MAYGVGAVTMLWKSERVAVFWIRRRSVLHFLKAHVLGFYRSLGTVTTQYVKRYFFIAVLAMAFVVAGCSSSGEKPTPKDDQAKAFYD